MALLLGLLGLSSASTVVVHMFNFNFTTDATHATIVQPVIHAGDTVRWVLDEGFHCTSSCAGMAESWASGIMQTAGSTFDHTFTTPGTYSYFCCLHGFDNGNGTASGMSGTVTVLPPDSTGTITLQDYTGTMPSVHIEVRNPGSTSALNSYDVVPAANGSFSFPSPAPGTYDIAFKASHWLRKVLHNVTVGVGGATGLTPSLINGDINGDNATSLSDFAQMRLAFGSTPSSGNWNPNADLNGNLAVALSDFAILRLHFGLHGDD